MHEKTDDVQGAFFDVLTKYKGQRPIQFKRVESELMAHKSLEDNAESP